MQTKNERNDLEKFLLAPENTHSRESLVNNRLLFDLKLAASKHGYFLNAYAPEVDQDGFDIIFDDQDQLAKVQLKTVLKGAKTATWSIHKKLLRPTPYTCEEFGFEPSPEGCGYEGGIILMQVDASSDFDVTYFFTDITVLCAFRDNILRTKWPPRAKTITRVFTELYRGLGDERVSIPKGMFLEARTPSSLLALMGLSSDQSGGMWRHQFMKLVQSREPNEKRTLSDARLIESVNRDLSIISPRIKSTRSP